MHCSATHGFSKTTQKAIELREGTGVAGDAHSGSTVKHRSRVRKDPSAPNLRQVHLVHAELFAELADRGFSVKPGDIGENITTSGIDLLNLPRGTQLRLGASAVVEITGLRNPCSQLDAFADGLMKALVLRTASGEIVRKAGVMSVVLASGIVRPNDSIAVSLPAERFPLEPV